MKGPAAELTKLLGGGLDAQEIVPLMCSTDEAVVHDAVARLDLLSKFSA